MGDLNSLNHPNSKVERKKEKNVYRKWHDRMGKMGKTAVRMVYHSQTLEKSQRRQHNSNANGQPVVACPSRRRIRPFASAPLFKHKCRSGAITRTMMMTMARMRRVGRTNHTKDSDDRIEQYISEATDCKYGLHLEQALGILLFHDYNVAKARQELKEYKPAETGIDAWDADDRTMFETAYRIHAKSFLKIQETLPNKKIADLVHYYYKWKKNKNGEHYYYNKWKKSKNGEKNEAAEQRSKTRRDRRNYPQSQCNMFDEDKEVPSPADIAQTLQALKGTPQWHLRHRREEDKKTEREITNGHQAIQKSKQMIACFQDEHALDFDEVNTLVDLDELKEDKTTKDWKDAEEIYKFTIGLRHQGTNFEQIAAIIRTKTAQQLKDFYEADLKENKFEFASNLSSGKEQRGREVKGKKGQAKHKPSSLESATPTTM